MVIPELEQQLLQLDSKDKLYIIQLLAQSLTTQKNNTHPEQLSKLREYPEAELTEKLDLTRLLNTLIESIQPQTPTEIREYPQPQFYGCIPDETFFRHPQGQQPEREPIL